MKNTTMDLLPPLESDVLPPLEEAPVKTEQPSLLQTGTNVLANIVRPVRGVGEAVVDTTAGIVGAGAGATAGLGMLPIVGAGKLFGGFKDVDLGDAYKAVQEGVANELTKYFQPTTEFGQMLMTPPQSTGDLSVKNFLAQIDPRRLITAPGEIGKELIDLPLESMKAPKAVKYPVETVAEFAAYPAAFKGAKSVKNIIREVLKEKGIELGTRKPVAPTRQELARGIRKLDNIEVSERAGEVAKEKLGQMKERPYEGPLPMLEAKEAVVTPKTEVVESDRIFNMLEQVREDLPTWEIDKVTELANKPAAMRTIEENLYLREFEKKYRDVAEPKAEEGAVEKPEYIGPREEVVVPEKSKIDPMTGKEKPASDFPLEEGVDALRGRLRKQEEPVGSTEELRDTYERLIKKEGKTAPSDTLELSRIGEFGEEGTYFGVKGQTQYEGGTNYTLSKAKIADVTDKDVAISLIDETLKNKDLTEEQISSLNEAKQNNGFIDYSLFDETPMAAAAKKLGYDAVKVFENQDFPGVPSSVFVVNTKKLSKAKTSEQRLYPAVQIDGKVYVAEVPDGTTHSMIWEGVPEAIRESAGSIETGWSNPDGSGFTKTPNKPTVFEKTEAEYKADAAKAGVIFNGMQERPGKASMPLFTDPKLKTTFTLQPGETVEKALKRKNEEAKQTSLTLYSDPLGFQASAKALGKIVESAKEGWDEVLAKNPRLDALDAKVKSRIEEIYRGVKEGTLDPERVMREDPQALAIFKEFATAEEKKNAFIQKIMPDYMAAIKGIKRGSKASERIGEALDGKRNPADLTQQEKKAYDFFKKTYDWMIHEYARQAAGSETAYHKILTLVRNKSTRATKVKDLKEADLKEYKNLWQKAKDIKGDKKLSELTSEQRESYDRAAQEARDFLRNDVKKSLNEGEAAAYDILSRKLSEYLPHLFDKKELKEMFGAELSKAKEKLGKATNKGVITRLKNRIAVLEKSLSTMKTGKLVNFRDLPHDIFFRFFEERRGKQGYSYDAIKAFETYLYGIARKIYDEPALRKSYKLYEDVKPELQPYTKELVNHYMGYGEKNRFENFSRMVTTLEWIRTLGFNPRSALVNLTQRLNTTVWVGEKYAAEAQYKMLFDRKWADDLLYKSGLAREIPQVLMEGPVAPSLKGLRTITGWMFDKVELGNRQHALISGYLKAIKEGKSEAAAIQEGIKVAHKTQFRYGKLGTPRWMRHPGGRIALQFISYPIKQAQFLYDLWKKDPLSFARWMGYTVGGNITLQELFDTDMSNYLGIGISFGEALKAIQFAAEGDMRGGYRHLKQAVTTGGGILPSGPGPAVSSLFKVGQALPKGRGTEQLIQEITPVMWNRLKQAYKAVKEGGEGEYPIFNEREKKYNLTGRQLIQRTVGPRSAYEYEQEMKVGQAKNLEQERTEIQQEIVKMFVDYKMDGDEEVLDKIVDLIDKYGDAVKPSDAAIKNEEARRLLTKEERVKPGRKEVYQIMREGEPII
jgi:hypothetical protein